MEEKLSLVRELLEPENQEQTVALARALCPGSESATDATMLICVALVEAGGDYKAVAECLGYTIGRIKSYCQSRLASQIMRQLAKAKLSSEGYVKALAALVDVAGSESQTGTARRNAAQAVIELVEADERGKGNAAEGGRELSSMTLKELESFVGSIKAELTQIASLPPVIDG
jgi:hypothetical protein